MNTKSYAMAAVAAAVFFFFYGFVANVLVLGSLYADMEASPLFRPEGEELMGAIALSCLLQACVLGYIFIQNLENKGWMEGARFGAMIGVFYFTLQILNYGIMPLSMGPMITSGIANGLGYVGLGAVFALVYKPTA